MVRDKRASEFGGVPGRIQPDPHEPTNSETLSLIYSTEPAPPVADDIPPKERPAAPRIRPEINPETFTPDTRRMR